MLGATEGRLIVRGVIVSCMFDAPGCILHVSIASLVVAPMKGMALAGRDVLGSIQLIEVERMGA